MNPARQICGVAATRYTRAQMTGFLNRGAAIPMRVDHEKYEVAGWVRVGRALVNRLGYLENVGTWTRFAYRDDFPDVGRALLVFGELDEDPRLDGLLQLVTTSLEGRAELKWGLSVGGDGHIFGAGVIEVMDLLEVSLTRNPADEGGWVLAAGASAADMWAKSISGVREVVAV